MEAGDDASNATAAASAEERAKILKRNSDDMGWAAWLIHEHLSNY
jgi:hypothetical protein